MKKLLCLVLALTMLMSLALISPAAAEDWKFERKIEIVCPWGLGGGADSTIRPMATLLQQKLGVPVEVRNETGAGGVTGIEYTYKQPADGYTFMLGTQSLFIQDMLGNTSMNFKTEMECVDVLVHSINMLVGSKKQLDKYGIHNFTELKEYAAAHPLSFLSNKGATGVYDWLAKPRADLWNTAKTCYDPCPVGYKVPDRDTWDDFADDQDRYVDGTSEWDGEKYGMTYIFGDLRDWYPTSGYRNRDKGNLAGLATTRTGHYWSNYRSGNTISCFYISKKLSTGKLLQLQSSSKSDAAYGYNVRCCRE